MTPDQFFYVLLGFAFALGAVVGSFLNVVIYRVPAGLSVVAPGSQCPVCKTPIRWYDNIPIISYFLLRGRCRHCKTSYSPRYALVEAFMGLLSAGLFIKVAKPHFDRIGAIPQIGELPPVTDLTALPWVSLAVIFGLYFLFLALLVVITFVDLDHYLIPHEFTIPGMILGVIAALVFDFAPFMEVGSLAAFFPPVTLSMSVIGLLSGGLAVVAIFYLYFALRGIEGVGGGDVTLMAVVGAWLGWPALFFIFFAASLQGIIAAAIGALAGAAFLKDSREILGEEDPREVAKRAREANENSDDLKSSKSSKEEVSDEVDTPSESNAVDAPEEIGGGLAVPFGPFISLAAVQYFFFGEFLPPSMTMSYFYYGFY